MSDLRFQMMVMTPNGPGLVQGLLSRPGKADAILVSHEPRIFAPAGLLARTEGQEKQVGEQISQESTNPAIWILFAYPAEMLSPLNGNGAKK